MTNIPSSKELEELKLISYKDTQVSYLQFKDETRNLGELVELDEDIYCYMFKMILTNETFQHKIQKFYSYSALIFSIQIALITLYWKSNWNQSVPNSDWSLYMSRFLCAFVLHLMIIPEIKQGL